METKIYKPVDSEQQIRKAHIYVKEWNKSHPLKADQIRSQHMSTMEMLIKIAIKKEVVFDKQTHIMRVDNGNGLRFEAGTFKDNGASIARRLNIIPKTFDSHLKRLRQAGIAASFSVPETGRKIRVGKGRNETLFAINKTFFID